MKMKRRKRVICFQLKLKEGEVRLRMCSYAIVMLNEIFPFIWRQKDIRKHFVLERITLLLLPWCKELLNIMHEAYIFGDNYIWVKYLKMPCRLTEKKKKKNLSQVLGKSFKISETGKSVTRLDGFRANPEAGNSQYTWKQPAYSVWATFSWTKGF